MHWSVFFTIFCTVFVEHVHPPFVIAFTFLAISYVHEMHEKYSTDLDYSASP